MAVVGTMQVTGFKELQSALKRLPANVARKVSRRAMRRGAVIIQQDAKRRAPVDTGGLRKNLKVVESGRASRQGVVLFRVRTSKGARHAYLMEYGTLPRIIKVAKYYDEATGRWRLIKNVRAGAVQARPFMRPAFDTKKQEAVRAIETTLKQGIELEARLLAAKGGR